MRILLMFCYFLLLITNASCRETSEKKSSSSQEEIESADSLQTVSKDKIVLCFGNSLTAGMGLDEDDAFPAVLQRKVDSLGLSYKVVNAGLSGETTASGKNRIEWVLNQKVDVFLLELGANDGLRGIHPNETKNNLQTIIDIVREKNPDTKIILAGMQMPPNLGDPRLHLREGVRRDDAGTGKHRLRGRRQCSPQKGPGRRRDAQRGKIRCQQLSVQKHPAQSHGHPRGHKAVKKRSPPGAMLRADFFCMFMTGAVTLLPSAR